MSWTTHASTHAYRQEVFKAAGVAKTRHHDKQPQKNHKPDRNTVETTSNEVFVNSVSDAHEMLGIIKCQRLIANICKPRDVAAHIFSRMCIWSNRRVFADNVRVSLDRATRHMSGEPTLAKHPQICYVENSIFFFRGKNSPISTVEKTMKGTEYVFSFIPGGPTKHFPEK